MTYNISLLVGLKNNLDYNKHFYNTTRKLYPEVEICFVSYGSTDGTHEWLDSLSDKYVRYYHSPEQKTFSETFNMAATIATSEYVAYLHNDIVLAPGFLENLAKHVGPTKVVSYTTIEPPIFAGHERPGKLIRDFGTDLQTFNLDNFYRFAEEAQESYRDKTEPGITFFMCLSRNSLLGIGGMDSLYNPMFCEDDDLITRLKLLGLECITSLDAICYHFVSKTSRFSTEYVDTTRLIEVKSNRNYIRKWGSRFSTKKYNIAFVVHNCNLTLLEVLEPWCDRIYVDERFNIGRAWDYVEKEQAYTKFDLSKRIITEKITDPCIENDIVVEFDGAKMTQDSYNILQQLPEIIAESGEVGRFELDIYKITISAVNSLESELITLDSDYYRNRLL